MASKRGLAFARKALESFVIYEFNEFGDVYLKSMIEALTERRKRLHLDDVKGREVVFSLDKGRGRVISTVSLVHHPRPCSYYNHLPLHCWTGPDTYDALKQRDIAGPYRILSSIGYRFFLGGDLSFLSTNFGLSCAMTYGCLWCFKRFDRRAQADKDSIDFVLYEERSNAEVEEEIRKLKLAHPKEKLIDVDLDRVVPPILHAKIKIGNELFSKLSTAAGNSPEFESVLKKCKLDVNRHEEGMIYSRFNGNDIKRLCRSIDALAGKISLNRFDYDFQLSRILRFIKK